MDELDKTIARVLKTVAEEIGPEPVMQSATTEKIRRAVLEEREACARICEQGVDVAHPKFKDVTLRNVGCSPLLARTIRDRGEK